jgi:hypothetical protein
MYGLIFDCFESFVTNQYGAAIWDTVAARAFATFREECEHTKRDRANIIEEKYAAEGWLPNCSYPDGLFSCLCKIAAAEVREPVEEIIQECGFYFIEYMR